MAILSSAEIRSHLKNVPEWRKRGLSIWRTFVVLDFPSAIKFVDRVAEEAENANHHPDIDVRWNKVTLVLSTHSEGGLSEKDFALATKLDSVFSSSFSPAS